jgi:hypothetical protein
VAVFSRLALSRGVLRLCSARSSDRCWGVRRAVARFDEWGPEGRGRRRSNRLNLRVGLPRSAASRIDGCGLWTAPAGSLVFVARSRHDLTGDARLADRAPLGVSIGVHALL